jgi:hypothetical protein
MLCGADFKRSLSRVSVFKSIANRESPEKERKIALLEKAFKTLERDMGNVLGHGMIYMTERVFFDTNILVYAYDTHELAKQKTAKKLTLDNIRNDCG